MLTLTGYIRFSPPPSFGLPIFRDSETAKLYIQFAEPGGEVLTAAFEEDENIVCELSCADIKRGSNALIYVFLDGSDIHVGTPESLAPTLRSFQTENPKETAVNLQIAEIVGTAVERERARTHLLERSKSLAKKSITRSLVTSMAYEDVWRALYESCKDEGGQRVLNSNRRRVSREFDFSDPYLLPHDLREEIEPHLRHSLREICESILLHISVIASVLGENIRDRDFYDVPADLATERKIRQILESVSTMPRQEQRISRLMKEILRDVRGGTYAMHRFEPKAAFERAARELILRTLLKASSDKKIQATITAVVRDLYSMAYPLQRGRFLLDMAKEMGDYPYVSDMIRRETQESQAMAVKSVRRHILDCLKSSHFE